MTLTKLDPKLFSYPKGDVRPLALDAAALTAAHASGGPVNYGAHLYSGDPDPASSPFSGTKYKSASHERIVYGRQSSPVADHTPLQSFVKYSNAARTEDPTAWDQAHGVTLVKRGGDAYSIASYAYHRAEGGSGDNVAFHARSDIRFAGAGTGAIWCYVNDLVGGHAAIGMEMNGAISGTAPDPGYGSLHQVLRIVTADNAEDRNRYASAISIGRNTVGGNNNGFYTGINFEAQSLVRVAAPFDDGEAIRINASEYADRFTQGIRFARAQVGHLGVFGYALRTDEATFADNIALRLGNAHKVKWGSVLNGVELFSNAGEDRLVLGSGKLNINDPVSSVALEVAGLSVVGTRKVGWGAATGTATRSTFATSTVTTAQLAERVKALLDDLTLHGLIGA